MDTKKLRSPIVVRKKPDNGSSLRRKGKSGKPIERVTDSGVSIATDHIPATTAIAEAIDMRGKDTYISIFWCLANRGTNAIVKAMISIERDTKTKGDRVIICLEKYISADFADYR